MYGAVLLNFLRIVNIFLRKNSAKCSASSFSECASRQWVGVVLSCETWYYFIELSGVVVIVLNFCEYAVPLVEFHHLIVVISFFFKSCPLMWFFVFKPFCSLFFTIFLWLRRYLLNHNLVLSSCFFSLLVQICQGSLASDHSVGGWHPQGLSHLGLVGCWSSVGTLLLLLQLVSCIPSVVVFLLVPCCWFLW